MRMLASCLHLGLGGLDPRTLRWRWPSVVLLPRPATGIATCGRPLSLPMSQDRALGVGTPGIAGWAVGGRFPVAVGAWPLAATAYG